MTVLSVMKSYWLITMAERCDGELGFYTTFAIDSHPADFMFSWNTEVAGQMSGRKSAVLLNQIEITAEQFLKWEEAKLQ